jgi:hypothetical protein
MEKNEFYKTSDLYLSSFLKLSGFKFSIKKNNKVITFLFEDSEKLREVINNYLTENATCDPLLFTNSIKNLKNLIYNS